MSATQYDDLTRRLAAHRARLSELEWLAATKGTDTPPHVRTEIRDIIEKIEELSGAAVEMTPREQYLMDWQSRMRLEVELIEIKRDVREMRGLIDQLLPHMAVIAAHVARLQTPPPPKPAAKPRRVNGE